MTESLAEFTIEDADSSDQPGYDVPPGGTVVLRLKDLLSPVGSARYFVDPVGRTLGDLPTFDPVDGIASPAPTSDVEITMPEEVSSFMIWCHTDGGKAVRGPGNKLDYTRNRFARIISVRSPAGLRKEVPAETTEYSRVLGNVGQQHEIVDAITNISGAGSLPFILSYTTDPIALAKADGNFRWVTTAGDMSFLAPTGFRPDGDALDIFIIQGATAPDTASWASGAGGFRFPTGLSGTLIGSSVGKVDWFRFRTRNGLFICEHHFDYAE